MLPSPASSTRSSPTRPRPCVSNIAPTGRRAGRCDRRAGTRSAPRSRCSITRCSSRTAAAPWARCNAAMPELGMHDIPFVDRSGGSDAGARTRARPSRPSPLVVAADREWIERIDRTVLGNVRRRFRRPDRPWLRRRPGSWRLFAAPLARDRQCRRGDHRRRYKATDAGQRVADDEFDQLAGVLNAMLEEIERLLENLRQVSSDVAHDLAPRSTHLRNALEESALGEGDAATRTAVIGERHRSGRRHPLAVRRDPAHFRS